MKRIFSIALCFFVILSFSCSVYAQEESIIKSYTLSLEDAISLAVANDYYFVSADIKINDAEKQLEQARKDQKNLKGAIPLPQGFANIPVKQGYYVEQARIGIESAKMEKEQGRANLAYSVTELYYSYKLCEATLKSAETAYTMALNNKNMMDMQFSLGLVSELDIKNAAYALTQAKNAVDRYTRSLDVTKEAFCIKIGVDSDCALYLTDGIEYEEYTTNLDVDITGAIENRYDLFMLKSVASQAEKYMDATIILGYSSAQHSAANQAKVQADYTYNNTKKLIGLSIKTAYNDILNARDNLMLAKENLEIKNQEYTVGVIQHDLGMITNTQLTGIMNNVTMAQIELENAKLTYKLAVEKYKYEITIGL